MDRRNYDAKAIGLFEIIGSYFVDVFYNNHYLLARDAVKGGRASNITDGYRANVISYMNGLTHREDLFKKVVHQLHEFYQRNSGFGSIVLSEFQDRVLSQFIPPEYYRDFADRHKDRTLREIINRTVNEFGEVVVGREVLPRIIDNHLNRENINLLQDRIVDIFILQREDYYSKFAREISKQNAGNTVDKDTVRKLKEAYIAEKKKTCDLSADRERAIHMIQQLAFKINQLEDEVKRLRQQNILVQPQPAAKPVMLVPPPIVEIPSSRRSRTRPKKTPYPSPTPVEKPQKHIPTDESDDEEIDDEELHRRQRAAIANRNKSDVPDPLDSPTLKLDTNITDMLLDDDPWDQGN